jgi:hypothetical protein
LLAELLKYGDKEMLSKLHYIILQIWIMDRIPKDWRKSIICLIHKKKDPMECHNNRGKNILIIALITAAGVQTNGTIFYKSVQLLACAEDTDIIA